MSNNETLNIEQAAEYLGIRKSTLESLLKQGKLSFTKVDKHLQVLIDDLIEYEKTANKARRKTLSELTQEAVASGTYFARPQTTKTR